MNALANAFIRKIGGLVFISAAFGPYAMADGMSAHLDLQPTESYKSHVVTYHDGGSFSCVGQPHNENFNPVTNSVTLVGGDGDISANVSRVYTANGQSDGHGSFTPRMLTLNFNFSPSSSPFGKSTVAVATDDSIFANYAGDDKFNCGHTSYSSTHEHSELSGTLSLNYQVPPGVWLIKSKLDVSPGLTNIDLQPSTNILKLSGVTSPISAASASLNALKNGEGKEMTIWVQPGSVVSIAFSFKKFQPGQPIKELLSWTVAPVYAESTSPQAMADLGDGSIDGYVARAFNKDAKQPVTPEEKAAVLARIVADPQLREQIIRGNRSEVVSTFIGSQLYKLALTTSGNGADSDLKGMASFAAFELAKTLLNDVAPFCDMVTIPSPYAGKTLSVRGLTLVWYYYSQALNRLQNYNFAAYQALFSEFLTFEQAGLTYDQVMRDPVKKAQLVKLGAILQQMDLSKVPFVEALNDINIIPTNYTSLELSPTDISELKANLEALAPIEKQFVSTAVDRIYAFKMGNSNPVKTSDLLTTLDQLAQGQDAAIHILSQKVAFLSFDSKTVHNINELTDKLITNNIAILQMPLTSGNFTSAFEPVRQAFMANEQEIKSLIAKARTCQ